jgi:tetratricopeptide (TPR) repeat protein
MDPVSFDAVKDRFCWCSQKTIGECAKRTESGKFCFVLAIIKLQGTDAVQYFDAHELHNYFDRHAVMHPITRSRDITIQYLWNKTHPAVFEPLTVLDPKADDFEIHLHQMRRYAASCNTGIIGYTINNLEREDCTPEEEQHFTKLLYNELVKELKDTLEVNNQVIGLVDALTKLYKKYNNPLMKSLLFVYSMYKNPLAVDMFEAMPKNELTHGFKALLLVQDNKLDLAKEYLTESLQQDPNCALTHVLLGCLNRDPEQVKRGLELEPDFVMGHIYLAQMYLRANNPLAEEHLRRALELVPSHTKGNVLLGEHLRKTGNHVEAKRCLLRVEDEPAAIASLASLYFDKGKMLKARTYAMKAIQKDPTLVDMHVILGKITFGNGYGRDAAIHFTTAVRHDRKNVEANCALGEIHGLGIGIEKNVELALKYFDAAITGNDWKWNSRVYGLKGEVLRKAEGRELEAKQCFLLAISRDENNAYALARAGQLYRYGGEGMEPNLAEAEQCLVYACTLNPNDPFAQFCLGDLYREMGQDAKALEHLTKALELDPNDADIPAALGELLRTTEPVTALAHLQKAIQLDANHEGANFTLAMLYSIGVEGVAQDMRQAQALLAKVIEINPLNDQAYFLSGALYVAANELVLARARLMKTLELAPDNHEAKALLDSVP